MPTSAEILSEFSPPGRDDLVEERIAAALHFLDLRAAAPRDLSDFLADRQARLGPPGATLLARPPTPTDRFVQACASFPLLLKTPQLRLDLLAAFLDAGAEDLYDFAVALEAAAVRGGPAGPPAAEAADAAEPADAAEAGGPARPRKAARERKPFVPGQLVKYRTAKGLVVMRVEQDLGEKVVLGREEDPPGTIFSTVAATRCTAIRPDPAANPAVPAAPGAARVVHIGFPADEAAQAQRWISEKVESIRGHADDEPVNLRAVDVEEGAAVLVAVCNGTAGKTSAYAKALVYQADPSEGGEAALTAEVILDPPFLGPHPLRIGTGPAVLEIVAVDTPAGADPAAPAGEPDDE